jgi:hypothetical protein
MRKHLVELKWNGLGHWVFKKSSLEIYNWGKIETLTELLAHDPNWRIVYQIAFV